METTTPNGTSASTPSNGAPQLGRDPIGGLSEHQQFSIILTRDMIAGILEGMKLQFAHDQAMLERKLNFLKESRVELSGEQELQVRLDL